MADSQAPLNFNPAELIRRVEDTEKRLQTKDAEIQVYKMLVSQMEEELAQAKKFKELHDKQSLDVDSMKSESEKTLTKAKSLLFEKAKIIKNQELQIEAFAQQIDSLKEVVRITKDLLQIRNLEIEQLETKISCIEAKTKAEQERYDLMRKKLETMIRHNGELKREYETQLCLFQALRERYNERELAKGVVEGLKQGINKIDSDNAVKTDPQSSATDDVNNDAKTTNNDLIEVKNQLDDTLSVLEKTLGLEQSKTQVPVDLKSNSNAPEADVVPEKTEQEPQKDEKTDSEEKTDNETKPEASSTLGSIISAIKSTVGLGSDDNRAEASNGEVVENK
ncbi:unnamed protein product [Phyllotreta striolata]|uniref:Uncharacterized protein n=1 Tax=Phyllotreta striolata TaxID=444603 RepID=A0A9N9TUP8_PHYSR|nr:unnamed protein product [Phyllotreta striolata]